MIWHGGMFVDRGKKLHALHSIASGHRFWDNASQALPPAPRIGRIGMLLAWWKSQRYSIRCWKTCKVISCPLNAVSPIHAQRRRSYWAMKVLKPA